MKFVALYFTRKAPINITVAPVESGCLRQRISISSIDLLVQTVFLSTQ